MPPERDRQARMTSSTRLLIACLSGIAGGLLALCFVKAGMAHDQPLALLVTVASFLVGPLALLIPIALTLCGAAIGAAVGYLAARAVDR